MCGLQTRRAEFFTRGLFTPQTLSLLLETNRYKAIYKIYTHEKKIEIEYTNLIRESRLLSEGLFSSF